MKTSIITNLEIEEVGETRRINSSKLITYSIKRNNKQNRLYIYCIL